MDLESVLAGEDFIEDVLESIQVMVDKSKVILDNCETKEQAAKVITGYVIGECEENIKDYPIIEMLLNYAVICVALNEIITARNILYILKDVGLINQEARK